MIAVDTNILVTAYRSEVPGHAAATKRLKALAEGDDPWALPVFVLGEFLRVVTHPRLFNPPSPLEEACANLESLLASPSVHLLTPQTRYWKLLGAAALEAGARGNLIFDAQIVALCREYGVRSILTQDRDFSRFRGLEVIQLKL